MKRIITSLFVALGAFIIAGCVSSNEMAAEYLEKLPESKDGQAAKIYVCLPTQVIHTNQTLNQIDGFFYLSRTVQDSIIVANTKFLNLLDDKSFLQQFNDNLLYHLRRTGLEVIAVANPNDLPAPTDKVFVMNIPQIEAEEFIKKSRSEFTEKNGTYYHYDYDLNGFSTNVWYLFSNDTASAVYYKNFEIMDKFKGRVEQIANKKATITGHFDRITINDVYKDVADAGKMTATLFVEKIINDYLAKKGRNDRYFLYSPISNAVSNEGINLQAAKKRTFQKVDNK